MYGSSKILFDQPNPDLIQRLVKRDFRASIQIWQVEAPFEPLDELVFILPAEFFGIVSQPKQSHLNIVKYIINVYHYFYASLPLV